jgi:hypothetical protein
MAKNEQSGVYHDDAIYEMIYEGKPPQRYSAEPNYYEKELPLEKRIEQAGLRAKIPENEKVEIKRHTNETLLKPDFEWNGERNDHILGLVVDVRHKVLSEMREVYRNQNITGVPRDARIIIKKRVTDQLAGWVAERASSVIPLQSAETIEVNVARKSHIYDETESDDYNPILDGFGTITEVHSLHEIFNTARKDIILSHLVLKQRTTDESYMQSLAEKKNANLDQVREIVTEISDIFLSYQDLENEFKRTHKDANVNTREIVRQEFLKRQKAKSAEALPPNQQKKQNAIINTIYVDLSVTMSKEVLDKDLNPIFLKNLQPIPWSKKAWEEDIGDNYRTDDERQQILEEAKIDADQAVTTIFREERQKLEKAYFGYGVTDEIIGNFDALVEVKNYDRNYMGEYIHAAEEVYDIILNGRELEDYKTGIKRISHNPLDFGYEVNGIQITAVDFNIKTKGPFVPYDKFTGRIREVSAGKKVYDDHEEDIEIWKEYSQYIRKVYGPDVAGERRLAQMYTGNEELTPIVVRFPADVTEEQIESINKLAKLQGISNFVIQRLPFTNEETKAIASQIITGLTRSAEFNTLEEIDQRLLNNLTNVNEWPI